MISEQIKQIQKQITAAYEALTALQVDEIASEEFSEVLMSNLHNVHQWSQELLIDEQLLEMIEKPHLRTPKFHLSMLNRYLKEPHKILIGQAYESMVVLHDSVKPWKVRGVPERPMAHLSPAQVMQLLKVKLYPWDIDDPYPALEHDESALVLYHPAHTLWFVGELASSFNRRLRRGTGTRILCRNTVSCFEIILARAAFHLRPETWQTLLDWIGSEALERLYEMGGTIEPLTWDTGQGEGVIVRLPWAKTS